MGTHKPHEYETLFYAMKQRYLTCRDELIEAEGAVADLMALNDQLTTKLKAAEEVIAVAKNKPKVAYGSVDTNKYLGALFSALAKYEVGG